MELSRGIATASIHGLSTSSDIRIEGASPLQGESFLAKPLGAEKIDVALLPIRLLAP
ncbi:hypothetical protein [Kaistia terrae]|uniref:Uncharacterized protein n=1 Tax=Kaistia terrae TaxID=537017 RepID=A0ABW0Q457_9HYPH|nr:hypothetical protein [Kaistia terrae]MCX5579729.1 hypothetical protein [Kaistia terrae]